jgi:uncharacterized heparinase superfamily protein
MRERGLLVLWFAKSLPVLLRLDYKSSRRTAGLQIRREQKIFIAPAGFVIQPSDRRIANPVGAEDILLRTLWATTWLGY